MQPIKVAYAKHPTSNQKPGNYKFYAPFNKRTLIGRNPVWISKKREISGLKAEIKSVHNECSD